MAFIEVNNVGFAYDSETTINDISFSLEEGEFLVIIGPNGSGKTTLLRLLAGLLEPDTGRIKIHGHSVFEAQQRGEIGFVPQNYNKNMKSFPATVFEISALGLPDGPFSEYEKQATVQRALALVQMEEFSNRRIGDLSGGQQQRVVIAQAIVREPRLLLLDEPTSGIDYEASRNIFVVLQEINRCLGTTVLLVSHDIEQTVQGKIKVACINKELCYFGDGARFWEEHRSLSRFWHIGG